MKLIFEYPFQSAELFSKRKSLRTSLLKGLSANNGPNLKIALLGGSTTSDIRQLIELMLLNAGIVADFFESEYNRYCEVVLFESRQLWAFSPDIVYIHTTSKNINFSATAASELLKYQKIWSAIKSNSNAIIIQNNFEPVPVRTYGNLEASTPTSNTNFINELNLSFSAHAAAQRGFYINDINHISTFVGTSTWFDSVYWNNYKIPYSTSYTPYVARSFSSITLAHLGKSKKCLVLDLDNTLWGGVIGDDGINGICLGEGDAKGEAYLDFQKYIKTLAERGILLAVCSKNNYDVAKSAFSHQDSFLKFSDFSSFQANWEPKTEGLKKIAEDLNLGLESLVFIDDNPAEREWIRKQFPMVAVPEIGDDVSKYSTHIDFNGYFESAKILAEDRAKIGLYSENKKRQHAESQFETYHEFLVSLEMTSEISTFTNQNLDRITQLVNKTNQFNLTAKKLSSDDVVSRMENSLFICLYGRLTDRFGDNGLVSVISGFCEKETVTIDIWVMSCRVFKRDLEYAIFDEFIAACTRHGIKKIIGIYTASDRNTIVADLYEKLGFHQISASEWLMPNILNYKKLNSTIKVEK